MNITTLLIVLLGCGLITIGIWALSPFIKLSIKTIQRHKNVDKNKEYD